MKLVILTGMPGAGKSEVAESFRRSQIPVIVMGDVVRAEVSRRGLVSSPENNRKVMLELREQDGLGAIAIRCVENLKESNSETIAIEGCRSLAEVDVFDDYAEQVSIICVHSSPKTRFTRLSNRGRKDDPKDWKTFRERDLREISVGLGGVIALCDIVIINEDSITELQATAEAIVERFK